MSVYHLYNTTSHHFKPSSELLDKAFSLMMQRFNCTFEGVEIVLVNEQEIVRINHEHLGKNYVTDIITFYYHDTELNDVSTLEGTLYICLPRVIEQAQELSISTEQEFLRIVVHGLLHLLDFKDDTKAHKENMTKEEDAILDLVNQSPV